MKTKPFLILLLITTLARLPLLFNHLWYDENFTLLLTRLPFDQMIDATATDVHPPLFYILTWLVGHWGGPAWLIRLPSLVFGLASLVVFRHVVAQLRVPRLIQPVTLVIMALAPMQLWYGTEARMYAQLEFFILLAAWAVLGKHHRTLCFALAGMLYTHNWGLIYFACIGIFYLVATYKRGPSLDAMHAGLSFVLAIAIWIAWANVLRSQMTAINHQYWITRLSLGQVVYYVYQQIWCASLPNPVGFIVTWIWLALGLVAAWRFYRHAAVIYVLTFVPLLLGVVASLAWQPILIFRVLIGIDPFLYILMAAPFGWLFDLGPALIWTPWPIGRLYLSARRAILVAIFVLPIIILALPNLYNPDARGNNAVTVGDYLAAHMQSGDQVVVTGDGGWINLSALGYHPIMLPECAPSLGSLNPPTRQALGVDLHPWANLRPGRVWLFAGWTPLLHQCVMDDLHAIIHQDNPVMVVQKDDMMMIGLWEIEK